MDKFSSNLEVSSIEDMVEIAWQQAIKYRFDPVVGRIHEEYLDMLKKVRQEYKKSNEKEKDQCTRFILN